MLQKKLQKTASFLGLVLLSCLLPTVLLVSPVGAAALTAEPPLSGQLPNELLEGGKLRIDGSNQMTAINQVLKQRYEKQFPGSKVELRDRGTEAALEELKTGEIDLAAIGRPLTATEKAEGLIEVPISAEKIAIIVGKNNPFQGSLTLEQLSQIFRGEITNWAEVGGADAAIRVIDRPEFSDTRLALQQYQIAAPDLDSETVTRLKRDDTVAVLDALGRDGIGYAIASQLVNQNKARPLQLVITQTVLPDDLRYPYSQTRGYAYRQDPGSVAQAFLGFAATPPGQAAVSAARLEEAKAIAAGRSITLPPPPPPPALLPDASPVAEPDRRRFLWVLLPLLLLGLLVRWLTQRRTKPIAPAPIEPAAPAVPGQAELASPSLEKLDADWLEDEPASVPEVESAPTAAPINEPISELSEPAVEAAIEPAVEPASELIREPSIEPALEPGNQPANELPNRSKLRGITSLRSTASALFYRPQQAAGYVTQGCLDQLEIAPLADLPLAEPVGLDDLPAPGTVIEADLMPVDLVGADLDVAALAEQPLSGTEVPSASAGLEVEAETAEAPQTAEAEILAEAVGLEGDDTEAAVAEVTVIEETVTEVTVTEAALIEETVTEGTLTEQTVPEQTVPEQIAPGAVPEVAVPKTVPEIISDAAGGDAVEDDASGGNAAGDDAIAEVPELAPIEPVVAEPLDSGLPAAPAAIAELAELEAAALASNLMPSDPADPAVTAGSAAPEAVIAQPTGELEPELPRLGRGPVKQTLLDYLARQGKTPTTATVQETYQALATLLCDRLLNLQGPDPLPAGTRLVGEISAEYLPGPHLENSLVNLGLLDETRRAVQELGLNWQQLLDQEEEPGLGRGGLGRLMVCYLDSLATANIPAIGYGIRYEYGIFDQEIQNGWQVEVTDTWLRNGNPWEVERPERSVLVPLGGTTEAYIDDQDRYRVRWLPAESVEGIPYDTPVPGYQNQRVSLLRLWRAEAGDLCKVLYPVDIELQGKALRLKQQFFLVSCALQDALRLHLEAGEPATTLAERFALQINDTDPTLAVAELMRLLVDEQGLPWDQAWQVTQATLAYTNHSLMPETLDDLWAVDLVGHFLPRHLEIIYEINYRLLEAVKAKYPGDQPRLNRMSLIEEQGERHIRLNSLACVGCHAVNGVSDLHTDLLKHTILRDFYELYPEKFSSQTNGVSPRRFLLQANPEAATLITSRIGNGWITDLSQLIHLERYASDPVFSSEWLRIKQAAKRHLATHILEQTGVEVNPNSLFDVQAMVMHEYKRQHLNLLHLLTLYNRIKANPNLDLVPRTVIFAGKAAPDYFTAKLMIKLIHAVAEVVNADPDVRGRLKVVF
ncbi:MAG: glycogen/starch/alpha-glucan phosphorylase, partial [Elainella sp.]